MPIITFINKMDREGRDPFELLDEIATTAGARRGADDLADRHGPELQGRATTSRAIACAGDAIHRGRARRRASVELTHPEPQLAGGDLRWSRGALSRASTESPTASGHLTPVFFGSALQQLRRAGAARRAGATTRRRRGRSRPSRAPIEPAEPKVTGFVFKVQANMDPNHRDRVAFVRLCSGRFRARHEADAGAAPASRSSVNEPDLLLRPRARDRRGGLARRHHRHPQPRRAARRRHADRGRGAQLHRHPQLRARDPAPRAAGRSDEGQAAAGARSRISPRRASPRCSGR